MKIRPLPDLDLARIAPLADSQKRVELRKLKLKFPPYSYSPVRRAQLEILNVDAGPLGLVKRAPWRDIAQGIIRSSRSEDEAAANLSVGEAIYFFANDHCFGGRNHDFYPLAIGLTAKVSFWIPAVIAIDGNPHALFIDPRRGTRLTKEGRRFAFSVMHERIRAADEDLAEIGLSIMQLDWTEAGSRQPKIFSAQEANLYSFSELDTMVRRTYEIWYEVLEEREKETRKRAAGEHGSLI